MTEQIIIPQKKVQGQQVRMQEELEQTDTEDTDFEVPFEFDQ